MNLLKKCVSVIVCSICFFNVAWSYNRAENQKKVITADQIGSLCEQLYAQISADNFKPDLIIGLSRGGLVPLGYLSGETMFDMRNVITIGLKSYEKSKQSDISIIFPLQQEVIKSAKSILVVDDLVDTGKTILFITKLLKEHNPHANIKVATLLYKPTSALCSPDYYVQETDQWIVFPWEKSN